MVEWLSSNNVPLSSLRVLISLPRQRPVSLVASWPVSVNDNGRDSMVTHRLLDGGVKVTYTAQQGHLDVHKGTPRECGNTCQKKTPHTPFGNVGGMDLSEPRYVVCISTSAQFFAGKKTEIRNPHVHSPLFQRGARMWCVHI